MLKKISLFTALLTITSFSQTDTLLIFSEVMFAPASGNNEFIEIYNLSPTDSVDLSFYKIKYYTSTADQIIDAGFGTILEPNSFAVIFENDYDIATGIYHGLVPPDALILKIADNSFGSSGMANTTNRPLWLLTTSNDTVDFYFYSANNLAAVSDEKIFLNRDSLQTNWSNSLVINGTPGFTNSVTPVNYDLSLYSLMFSPAIPISGDNVTITAKVKNNGVLSAVNFSIELFNDINLDSIPDLSERIFYQDFFNLLTGDSVIVSTILSSLSDGNYQVIAKVNFSEDQNTNDNLLIKQFYVFPPGNIYNDIVINEIMYAPSTGEPEWIELFNRTNNIVSIKNWKLSDAASTITITGTDIFIAPESFIVITKDSSILNFYNVPSQIVKANIPSLNNTGDAVVIKDDRGLMIDSVYYLPDWGGNIGGKSLERISADSLSSNPANWAACINISKATPGDFNSITQKDYDIKVTDLIFNPIYPLLGDNITFSASVKNTGKNIAIFSIELYEDSDLDSIPDIFIEAISNLTLSVNDSSTYQFNYTANDLRFKKAFFIKAIYNQDQDTSDNFKYKIIEPGYPNQAVVVNEIMFAPLGGEPEWIELFNNTDAEINLKDWSVWDVITTPAKAIIKNNFLIPPKGYVLLTKDSSIFNYHRFIPSGLLKITLPSFNNDRDGVVLKDKRGLTIDSVFYSNQWGGTNGFSLERISVTNSSNNQFNWASSYDIEQSTPGRINSITPKQFDLSVTGISFNPRFPAAGDDISLTAKIKNNGNQTALNFYVEFYFDSDSNNVADMLLSSVNLQNLLSGDSIAVTSTVQITNLQKKILTAARVVFQQDEDTLNNYYEKSIQPGYAKDIIKINEVMYNPADGKPEWVELINVSSDSINIKNWMISDVLTTPTKSFITNENIFIASDELFVIAKDTSFNSAHPDVTIKVFYSNFGSLGNTTDGVVVYDFRNAIIDSLFYRSSWGNVKGYSLERISLGGLTNDSLNWATSLDIKKSTPGKQNSFINIPAFKRNDLIINEIMYDPENYNSEFIEFYNIGLDSINIGGWKIEDENGNYFKLSQTSFLIPPKEHFLLIADSIALEFYNLIGTENKNILNQSSLGLVNTGELILLKDVRNNIIDSVFYNPKWHNQNIASTKNKSLERINPSLNANDPLNWSTSVALLGGTPGSQNSIFAENLNQSANISLNPNPFSPDNDGFEDFTIINYNLTEAISQVRIKIFDSKGRLVRTLLNNQASASSGSVIFDGLDDDKKALRIGIYIVFLEALNDNSGIVETLKTVVVVARKL